MNQNYSPYNANAQQQFQGQNFNYNNNTNPYGAPEQNSQPNFQNQAMNAMNTASMGRSNNNYDLNRNMEQFDQQNYGNKNEGSLYADSRKGFIRKVYTLLSIQLVITALVCLWAMNSQTFKKIFMNTAVIIIVSVLLLAVSIVISCCVDVVRKFGLPVLIIFTLLFSILIGITCATTNPQIVLTAAGITAVIVIGLTIFACVTKTDLTGCGPYLFVLCLVLLVFGIVCIFWKNPIAHLVYACLAALLFSVYLIFDTQMVLGKFENAYTLDDAYFAAIQLYIDIVQIFLQVLRILEFINN